jgi:hypothetical protein
MASYFNNIRGAFHQLSMAADLNSEDSYLVPYQKVYDPSPRDVILVKNLLRVIASLPQELIDTIIDLAEYWPCVTTINSAVPTVRYNGNQLVVSNNWPLNRNSTFQFYYDC